MTDLHWSLRHPRTAARRLIKKLRRSAGTKQKGRDRRSFLDGARHFAPPKPTAAAPDIRVAVAAGPRLCAALAWEWSQAVLAPAAWRATILNQPFDALLIEIVYGAVTGWDPAEAAALLEWARSAGVPSVAWVVGASNERNSVPQWAASIDHVFVDNADAQEPWQAELPAVPVGVLEPAAQPRLHNPRLGGGPRRERAVGVVVHDPTSDVLTAVAEMPTNQVDIWPANPETSSVLAAADLGRSLVAPEFASTLSRALNRYSVVTEAGAAADSEFAWRVIEAASAQTCVVAEQDAISRLPVDIRAHVLAAKKPDELVHDLGALLWQPELRDRSATRLMREVHGRHTYAHRVDTIAQAVQLVVNRPGRTVSAVVPTNRAHEIDNIFDNIARQHHIRAGGVELILVLHGLGLRHADLRARAEDAGVHDLTLVDADPELTLGACMNMGVSAASGDYIAKMDDDNYYGRHYLTDLVAAFGYTDAGIVGKWAYYVWLRSTGAVLLRCPYAEHRYERLVQGGSMLMTADVARELPFSDIPRAVDTDLLNRAQEADIATYSSDRFNFVSIRNADRTSHTWTIADAALMNRAASLVFYGDPREHVDI